MSPALPDWLQELLAYSQLLGPIQLLKQDGGRRLVFGDEPLRALTKEEIGTLERQRNSCSDWSALKVVEGFRADRVRDNRFYGPIALGRFAADATFAGVPLPTGIVGCTLVDCVVGHDCLLNDVRLLSRYAVSANSVIFDCGQIACEGPSAFGNDEKVPIGIETGGRDVPVFAEMSLDIATTLACQRKDPALLAAYDDLAREYASRIASSYGWIGEGSRIRHSQMLSNCLVGPGAEIEAVTHLADCTLLSDPQEPVNIGCGAIVRKSLVQWSCRVTSGAHIERSMLLEHSHVESHGHVTNSILGPNSGVSKGEVTSCLVGPFVGMHHQSLLIATIWPEGKGNIGYGANVGSNHTGKAPDQEFWPGEGAFLGLGVNIKFPADFRQAPYTLIASGVTTLPQRMTFPFSLINGPARTFLEIPRAYNEIFPGWLLTDNAYTLRRNESKYKARNKARRHRFDFSLLRADIVKLVQNAERCLREIPTKAEIYTEKEIAGLGKNYLTEPSRLAAIEAYRSYIALYALMQLEKQVMACVENSEPDLAPELLTRIAWDTEWEAWRTWITTEYGIASPRAGLERLSELWEKLARDVERSKAKDDERGHRIQDDYFDVHKSASQDAFVLRNWEETRSAQSRITELLQYV